MIHKLGPQYANSWFWCRTLYDLGPKTNSVNSLDNPSYNCKVQTHYLMQLSTTKEEEGFNPHEVNKWNNYFHRFYSIPLHLYGVLGKNHLADGYRAMEIMSWSTKASLLQASKLVFSPISKVLWELRERSHSHLPSRMTYDKKKTLFIVCFWKGNRWVKQGSCQQIWRPGL